MESVDFWYPILNSKDGYFDVGIHHNGALQGETKKHPAKHYLNTAADINFSKSFNPGTLYLNLGYQNEWFNYYGDNELGDDLYQYLNFNNEPVYRYQLMPEHQSLNRLAFTLGMRSDGVLSSNWFYNAYLGAMKADGREFAAYTPLTGNRYHGMNHCYMHTDCCTANGPRGFLCFLRQLFRRKGDTATFNFYASALVPGFDMYALYPRTDSARIVSHTTGKLKLRLRIPSWSAKTEVKLNGKAFADVKAGTYFTIDHDWALGDIVEIKFDMPVVQHVLDHHVAFTRGPVLLARDSRFNDGDLTEPLRSCVGDVVHGGASDGQVMTTFTSVRTPSEQFWMTFSATLPLGPHHANPEGANPATVFFCDYASAGNLWRRENYYRTWFPVEIPPESR